MKQTLYLFGQLQDRDIDWMIRRGQKQQLAPGTTIIEEGKPLQNLYFVLEGSLGVWVKAQGDKMVARLGSGEVVGEMSFIDARPPSATVRAITRAVVLAFPRDEFAAHLEADTAFAAHFYRGVAIFLSDRLREARGQKQAGGRREEDREEDELDLNVLDNVHLAGSRFHEVLQRLLAS
jgi:CRP-like cAMP-binding protein